MILQTLLLVLVVVGLYKADRGYVILPFLVSVLSMMPMTIAACLQYCDVYYITLTGAALIAWKYGKMEEEKICFLFLILGMATSYFDFLTYPFVSLGIPLTLFVVFLGGHKASKQLMCMIWSSALWCVGYVGMWAGKWILGSILMPEAGSLDEALQSIAYRGSHQAEDGAITVFDVLLKNMYVYLKWPVMILMGITAIYFLWKIISKKCFDRKALLMCIPYVLLALYPLGWYMIAQNHSYEHSFMAYRELAIAAFAGLCMLAKIGVGNNGETN